MFYNIQWLWFEIIFRLGLSQEDGLKGFFSQSKLTGDNQVYCDECEVKTDTTTVSNNTTDWMYHHLNREVLTRLLPFSYSVVSLGMWSRTLSKGSCAAAQEIWVQLLHNGLREKQLPCGCSSGHWNAKGTTHAHTHLHGHTHTHTHTHTHKSTHIPGQRLNPKENIENECI